MNKLVFEEVTETEVFADYTRDCSGDRSDCCTRVCTRKCDPKYDTVSEEEWGKFLEVEGGVIQYLKMHETQGGLHILIGLPILFLRFEEDENRCGSARTEKKLHVRFGT